MSVNLLARHTAVTTPCRPFSPWVTTLCSSTPARSGDLTVFSKKHYSSKSWGFFVPQPELTQSGSCASRCFSPCKRIWRSERTGHIHRRGSAGRVLSSRNLRHVEVSGGWTNRGDFRAMASIQRDTVGPGQESVWDYPRPPRLEPVQDKIKIVFNGETIAETTGAYRVLETSHPPVYYIPTADFKMEHVTRAAGRSFCEWKGDATWWSISVGAKTAEKAAWSYESPTSSFLPIKGFLAVYAGPMDACFVGEEKAQPQPGNFYGGWVTSKVVGPFKGGLGSYGCYFVRTHFTEELKVFSEAPCTLQSKGFARCSIG